MNSEQLLALDLNAEAPFSTHLSNLQRLDQAYLGKTAFVTLSLGGYMPLRPSLAGSYLAALRRCQSIGTKIAATAFTPLIGSLGFVWLASDVRRMAPSSYLFLMPPPAEEDADERLLPLKADAEHLIPRVEDVISAAELAAYRHCLAQVSEVVEPGLITGRALYVQDLKELLLLGALPDCIANPIGLTPPSPSSPSRD